MGALAPAQAAGLSCQGGGAPACGVGPAVTACLLAGMRPKHSKHGHCSHRTRPAVFGRRSRLVLRGLGGGGRALALPATDVLVLGGVNSDPFSAQPSPREHAFFFSQLIRFIIINDGFLNWGFTGLWAENFMERGESAVSGSVGV